MRSRDRDWKKPDAEDEKRRGEEGGGRRKKKKNKKKTDKEGSKTKRGRHKKDSE